MPDQKIKSLEDSIKALASQSYDLPPNHTIDIYLDPENEIVFSFTADNSQPIASCNKRSLGVCVINSNAIPESAVNKRALGICTVGNGASPESVAAQVMEIYDDLVDAIGHYQGSSWDGRYEVGEWAGDEHYWRHWQIVTGAILSTETPRSNQ